MLFQNEILFITHLGALLAGTVLALRHSCFSLTLLICVEALLANLFVTKEVSLFGLSTTSTDVFAVASLFGLNLLREFYGKDAAKRAANATLGLLLFFTLMAIIHLLYQPSLTDRMHTSFKAVLLPAPRIFIASLSVYYLVQRLDLWFFSKMQNRWSFFTRISSTLMLSETIDTALFTFFGLYGILSSIGSVFFVSLLMKWFAILLSAPFSLIAKRMVKNEI